MIIAQIIIASLRTNHTPDEVLLAFYATKVCEVGEVNYTVSEFLGGWYRLENANRIQFNWINISVEELFNPYTGRALKTVPRSQRSVLPQPQLQPLLSYIQHDRR